VTAYATNVTHAGVPPQVLGAWRPRLGTLSPTEERTCGVAAGLLLLD
jgi:hypothetical protein